MADNLNPERCGGALDDPKHLCLARAECYHLVRRAPVRAAHCRSSRGAALGGQTLHEIRVHEHVQIRTPNGAPKQKYKTPDKARSHQLSLVKTFFGTDL